MKHITLFILLLLSCSVDIKQIPDIRSSAPNVINKFNAPLYIGKFDIISHENFNFIKEYRQSFETIVNDSKLFKFTKSLDGLREIEDEYYLTDIVITPGYKDKFNWFVTWPAIWPIS